MLEIGWLESLVQDVRYGARFLRKTPAFTLMAVLTLAIGIGVNTTIFSMVDWLVLRPLPVADAHQLTYLVAQVKGGGYRNSFSYPHYDDIRSQTSSVFSYVAGVEPFQMDGLTVNGDSKPFWTNYVTSDFFPLLGIQPALGRFILPDEAKSAGADAVLVISYSCWQSRFAGDPNVIGREVAVNGRPVRIIGVAPKGFGGPIALLDTQGYLPVTMFTRDNEKGDALTNRRQGINLIMLARLKPGVSAAQAQPVLEVVAKRMAAQYPATDNWSSIFARRLTSAPPGAQAGSGVKVIAGVFLGLSALVLLLGCVNVTNLLLVRGQTRAREMAVRSALGAARLRLIRQGLTESMLLALLGCGGGLLLGFIASHALNSLPLGTNVPINLAFSVNWRVFAYALAAAVLTGAAVGLIPALRASRLDLNSVLHSGGRSMTPARQRLRSVLVAGEIGGSLTLLIVAGLFLRSLQMAQHIDLGFNPSGVLNISTDVHEAGYDNPRGSRFYQELLSRVRNLPGVQSATIAATMPMGLYSYGSNLKVPGYQTPEGQRNSAGYNAVSPGYFSTLQIALLRGREFAESDGAGVPLVAVINQAMADKFWKNQDPIGRTFQADDMSGPIQIVGVARNSITGDIDETPGPFFYVPFAQKPFTLATLQLRSSGDLAAASNAAIGTIHTLNQAVPIFDVQSMSQSLQTVNGLLLYKLGAGLAAVMGGIALLLAIVGVYGVVSYSVSQRTPEIGVRMALGARAGDVARLIIRQGIVLVGSGLAVGILLAAGASQAVGSMLVGVRPYDPLTYAVASLLLALAAVVASCIPARRAALVDPMVALRSE